MKISDFDIEDMIVTLLRLPRPEQEKLYYMMKGVQLSIDTVSIHHVKKHR